MKSQVRVVGNLALAPIEEHAFSVIDGSAAQKMVVPSRPQLFDPVAYPNRTALDGIKRGDRLLFTLVAVLVSACVFGGMFAGAVSRDSRMDALMSAPSRVVEVVSGDTLWDIATDNPIEGITVNETVDVIKKANDLDSGLLVPGMELRVPITPR